MTTTLNTTTDRANTLADTFISFAKDTAKSIIEMSRAVAEAKNEDRKTFAKFCELTKIDSKSSTCRKYIAIGKAADHLIKEVDSLPNNWTTLYKLSQLTSDEFTIAIDKKIINREITAINLTTELRNAGFKLVETKPKTKFSLALNVPKTFSPEDIDRIVKDVKEVAARYDLTFSKSVVTAMLKQSGIEA